MKVSPAWAAMIASSAWLVASVALAQDSSLLERALSCQVSDSAIATLMPALALEDPGLKTPTQALAAPSGNLYRLARPASALGYSSAEIYVAPGRIAMAVPGQTLSAVSAKLALTPDPYAPAERRLDATHALVAYALHQPPLAGKVLVGCAYDNPAALQWLGSEGF